MIARAWKWVMVVVALLVSARLVFAALPDDDRVRPADASIDLASVAGADLVKGVWRYRDVRVVETEFRAAGADGQPTGDTVRSYDISPHAGGVDFDDSNWERISPDRLSTRRGNGRLGFAWYRIAITVPERIGAFSVAGSTAVFETVVDDYAEIWVDGELSRGLGQSGGSVIKGWNAPNRLVIGRNLRPGQVVQLAVFGVNGPLSDPPTNFIYLRYARLDFYRDKAAARADTPREVNIRVDKRDEALDTIVPLNPKLFKLADGFTFTEGPVWGPDGSLLFSDPNENRIYRYHPELGLSIFREQSGYAGADIAEYKQPGSNGLSFDRRGRLTINEHGNRRVTRLETDGRLTVLADRYQGRRLNSPNDLVYRRNGDLYFTDPPFGLPQVDADARKELPHSGVYCLCRGALRLLTTELVGPNGIAFSPDEKYLYVGNWDPQRKLVMRYPVERDGGLGRGTVFIDLTQAAGDNAIDGVKVDRAGNVYISGPGGLWIVSPAGTHLGTLYTPRHVHNMAWGDADGRTLYLTAQSALYRIRLNIPGVRP